MLDGIRLVSTLFATNRLKAARGCSESLAELPGYSWDDDGRLKGEGVPVKVDDHGLDTLPYGIKATEGM